MDAPQYVHVVVHSDVLISWTIYYKHHSSMDTPQYAHVDVLELF